jgi:hypothetical protein
LCHMACVAIASWACVVQVPPAVAALKLAHNPTAVFWIQPLNE